MHKCIIFIIAFCSFFPALNRPTPDQPPSNAFQQRDTGGIYTSLDLSPDELKSCTAVYSLENGGKSLATRLWLFEHAQRSIDIQYYSFSRNLTGLIACEYLIHAADKGIKIRILVDEAASRMNSYEIKVLDSHENIEIRVYNAGLRIGKLDKRLKKLASNSKRLLRRMHNKTLVVDGQAAITGGRNISDEYFDFDKKYNFRDRDILLIGKEVESVSASFGQFWNSELTVKVEDLAGKRKQPFDVRVLFEKVKKMAKDTVAYAPAFRSYIKAFPEEIRIGRQKGAFIITPFVSFVSDVPGKNENRKERKGGNTTDTIIALIRSARHSIDIQSPYFITTEDGKRILLETVERGVKVRILTNSMASIDNLEAFSAYKKDRKADLAAGIELFEFRPDAGIRFDLMIPEMQAQLHFKPVLGFHSKTMIIDGNVTVVGSYNLDPRSADYNTECIAVIRSRDFAKNLSGYVDKEYLPQNSWRINSEYNPDKEAPMKKRLKTACKRIYPKKLL